MTDNCFCNRAYDREKRKAKLEGASADQVLDRARKAHRAAKLEFQQLQDLRAVDMD